MGHLAALPSPSLAQACGRAGAGKSGCRLRSGVGRGGDGHGRACGCRVEGRAGGQPGQFDLPQTFSVSEWLAAWGLVARFPLVWCRSPARASGPPRRGPAELQPPLCALRGGGSAPSRALGAERRGGGQETFPPRPYPGGNQSSLLFSMSLWSLPFVPRYLSLPGIRAAPRWFGEGLAVAKISH